MFGINDSIWKRLVILLAALLATGALAGCVGGEEEEAGFADDEGLGTEDEVVGDEGGAGDEGANVDDVVLINGAVYQCDTFAEITNMEGVCDEYQLEEGSDPADFADAPAFEAQNELVMINGVEYRCDDEFGLGTGAEEGAAQNDTLTEDEEVFDEGTAEEEDALLAEDGEELCDEYVVVGSDE